MTRRFTYVPVCAVAAALFALAGCVAEDYGDCPPEAKADAEMFTVRVTDLATGDDITDTAGVEDAELVVFDSGGGFVARVNLTADRIGREMELPVELLTRAPGERFVVSAWGNLRANMAFEQEIGPQHSLSSQFLSLKANDEYVDNWYNPGNMFFGLDTLTLGRGSLHVVELTQKTARMAVSVRGLPAGETADDYYFSMCEQNDGFTFEGVPLRINQWCKIREQGVFNAAGEFTTDEPYYVIPSTDPADVSACNAGVCLYKVGGGLSRQSGGATRALTSDQAGYVTEDGDLNVTGKARVDIDGNHLALLPGQTTNVLISFTETGDMEIRVRMTAWDETYDWHTW